MSEFIKSFWFPIILFIIIELIFFIVGFLFMGQVYPCQIPPCPSGNQGFEMLLIGILPSALISMIVYFLIKRFSK